MIWKTIKKQLWESLDLVLFAFFCIFDTFSMLLERSHSGLVHTLGKGAYRKISGVRISLSPPVDLLIFIIMLNFISKLAQKPKDKTIRITRIVFALFLLLVIILGWNVTRTEFNLPEEVKYILFIFPVIGLIRGIFDPGVWRKKIWKWTVFGFGVSMILLSFFVIEDQPIIIPSSENVATTTIDLNNITTSKAIDIPFTLSTDTFFAIFGFILIIIGLFLNGKNITLKNERYGEIVKKIRV